MGGSLVPLLWGFTVFAQTNSWNSCGGRDRLRFGTNASGLTATQVRQIEFWLSTSSGLPHTCTAKILPDGEVVPLPIGIAVEQQVGEVRLFWPPGFILQTST